jgi:hypothetical protein
MGPVAAMTSLPAPLIRLALPPALGCSQVPVVSVYTTPLALVVHSRGTSGKPLFGEVSNCVPGGSTAPRPAAPKAAATPLRLTIVAAHVTTIADVRRDLVWFMAASFLRRSAR